METQIIGVDTLGIISEVISADMQIASSKRKRKQAFNDFVKLIKLSRLIPETVLIRAIGRGCDSNGFPVYVIYYVIPDNQEPSDAIS
jgi:hypothetical protein